MRMITLSTIVAVICTSGLLGVSPSNAAATTADTRTVVVSSKVSQTGASDEITGTSKAASASSTSASAAAGSVTSPTAESKSGIPSRTTNTTPSTSILSQILTASPSPNASSSPPLPTNSSTRAATPSAEVTDHKTTTATQPPTTVKQTATTNPTTVATSASTTTIRGTSPPDFIASSTSSSIKLTSPTTTGREVSSSQTTFTGTQAYIYPTDRDADNRHTIIVATLLPVAFLLLGVVLAVAYYRSRKRSYKLSHRIIRMSVIVDDEDDDDNGDDGRGSQHDHFRNTDNCNGKEDGIQREANHAPAAGEKSEGHSEGDSKDVALAKLSIINENFKDDRDNIKADGIEKSEKKCDEEEKKENAMETTGKNKEELGKESSGNSMVDEEKLLKEAENSTKLDNKNSESVTNDFISGEKESIDELETRESNSRKEEKNNTVEEKEEEEEKDEY
ncbi:uncharacterized protein [Diadema antillarum]|uniref:uncharacterized protein n=1 Tax=Diadema antillarum TaxID=105358 RepID=UPI003A862172